MNVTITIGEETLTYARSSKEWINKLFARARQQGSLPCVVVQIGEPGFVIGLSTPNCGRGKGGGSLTPAQSRVVEAWVKHRLTTSSYTGGNLIAFLSELERLVR